MNVANRLELGYETLGGEREEDDQEREARERKTRKEDKRKHIARMAGLCGTEKLGGRKPMIWKSLG